MTERDRTRAEALKTEGNACFQKGKWSAAAERYTEALTLCPDWAVLLVNRAQCHRKQREWRQQESDCRRALKIDGKSMKGHYFLGIALFEQTNLSEAVQHLTQALDLARESGDSIRDQVWHELGKAKYASWENRAAQRQTEHRQLQQRLQQMLQAKQAAESSGTQGAAWGEMRQQHSHEASLLSRVFAEVGCEDEAGSVAGPFTCQLTMEPFREPVITPSGLSYERSALLDHLNKVGHFDPVTRQKMAPSDIRLNVGLRAATQQYLDEHGWAWKETF
ncbi:hypothetical protein WJX74_008208 [Apatococcus lobatus]|uniref:RING-type E3 ubiquitin transferase n=1 Tax=Apatococcus lobatus TaxID=904363 RepID=A0AAW1QHP9_9CHLO